MEDTNQTNVIKICGDCGADLLERDKYCRRCGTRQFTASPLTTIDATTIVSAVSDATADNILDLPPVTPTSALSEEDAYHKISGPLVEAVTLGIAASAFSKLHNRFVRHALPALLSIPIWLMIILLSPFDAYFAAKHISSQETLK